MHWVGTIRTSILFVYTNRSLQVCWLATVPDKACGLSNVRISQQAIVQYLVWGSCKKDTCKVVNCPKAVTAKNQIVRHHAYTVFSACAEIPGLDSVQFHWEDDLHVKCEFPSVRMLRSTIGDNHLG